MLVIDLSNLCIKCRPGNEGQIIGSSEGDDHYPMDIDNPDHDSMREGIHGIMNVLIVFSIHQFSSILGLTVFRVLFYLLLSLKC